MMKNISSSKLGYWIILFALVWIIGTFVSGLIFGEHWIVPFLGMLGWLILIISIGFWLWLFFKKSDRDGK
jgi:hypothetical protein